jgi:hypothetical protein
MKIRFLIAILGLGFAQATTGIAAEPTQPTQPAWIKTSDAYTQQLLAAQAAFAPERASQVGLATYDGFSADFGPRLEERSIASMQKMRGEFAKRLDKEKDVRVQQDLSILIGAIDEAILGLLLERKYNKPWTDVPKLIFGGLQSLLQPQLPESRRQKALERLQRYVGLSGGKMPLVEQAKLRWAEQQKNTKLLGPVAASVEKSIENTPIYMKGIRALFTQFHVAGAEPALLALEQQLKDYAQWQKTTVLPAARTDFRLPAELYAYRLKRVGIDISPATLIERAQLEFMETRAAMQALAPVVAQKIGMISPSSGEQPSVDYRAVIAAMKRNVIPNDQLETHYRGVNKILEEAIKRERIVDLPQRELLMRLASEAESAAQPAPHMQAAQLIGNTGERGQFVLPLGNPASNGKEESYDDFNYPGASWTLSAHEGRPGHELQFSAMVERGVSLARSLYAFNSVNVEGWALYAEAETLPYEPVEGQMIALQFRLMRAARAILDPMLNLGQITRPEAERVLRQEVCLSSAMARQELDRYTFNMPAQAGSYFYGYTRILQLRAETEITLGAKFDRLAFNNFLLDQGLLPPDLLAKAVRSEFIPAAKAK